MPTLIIKVFVKELQVYTGEISGEMAQLFNSDEVLPGINMIQMN